MLRTRGTMWQAAFILCAGLAACAAAYGEGADMDAVRARALVSAGDTARIQHALAKARRGEAVTVGVIGGSITGGASASK